MKKQLRYRILWIFTIWDYDCPDIRKYKLLGITIAKRWPFNSNYNN